MPRQPATDGETTDSADRLWRFGNERWMLAQCFAARIEVARRASSPAERAAILAALLWQRDQAMRAVSFRQQAEAVAARLRRPIRRPDKRGPPSQPLR